jgi:tetratricopeptide (TPR) repeat protein
VRADFPLRRNLTGKSILNNPLLHFLLIVVVGLLAYSNTFNVPYHLDDTRYIVANDQIRDFDYYLFPFTGSLPESELVPSGDAVVMRNRLPIFKRRLVTFLSFALNYRLHGLDVTGYHVVNLLIHIINAGLLYLMVLVGFKTPLLRNSEIFVGRYLMGLFSALLFIAHPVQTQAVTYISQRFATLAALFYLSTLLLYLLYRINDQKRYIVLSVVCAIIAMKAKEHAFTVPFAALLVELCFFSGPLKPRLLRLIPLGVTLFVVPISLIEPEMPLGEALAGITETQLEITRTEYFITQVRVILTYIRLLVFLVVQNFDYDYPIYQSLLEPEVLISGTLHIVLVGTALCFFIRSGRRLYNSGGARAFSVMDTSVMVGRLLSFGVLWFYLALSVESSFVALHNVIFEHRVYLPSVGVFWILPIALFAGAQRFSHRFRRSVLVSACACCVAVIIMASTTYLRNSVWTDRITLWEDVVNKSPNKNRAHIHLGLAYYSNGMMAEAMNQFEWNKSSTAGQETGGFHPMGYIANVIDTYSLGDDVSSSKRYFMLGVDLASKGYSEKAAQMYRTSIELWPSPLAYNNLGNLCFAQGDTEMALEMLKAAINLDPNFESARYNLGRIYFELKKYEKAADSFKALLDNNPDDIEARRYLEKSMDIEGQP